VLPEVATQFESHTYNACPCKWPPEHVQSYRTTLAETADNDAICCDASIHFFAS
jgi:hypothetical protein